MNAHSSNILVSKYGHVRVSHARPLQHTPQNLLSAPHIDESREHNPDVADHWLTNEDEALATGVSLSV